jgi:biotin synthase
MDYGRIVERALRCKDISREECLSILHTPHQRMLELLQAAFRVRETFFGRKVSLHILINAKSGLCPEDCAYCSQSSISAAPIGKYSLLDEKEILEGARAAKSARAVRYCIACSGRNPSKQEVESLCRVVRMIKREMDISVCLSLGFLTEERARVFKEAGVDRYNHNLNTSERFYARICTTHSYRDRVETLWAVKRAGLELCCGAIFGMGESEDDIIDLFLSLKEAEAEAIPINFLHPIPGTPLGGINYLTPIRCLSILCLARFLNPDKEIRVAGGREFHLRSLQPLALYPANSIFVSGYLTTPGQGHTEAIRMIEDMGLVVDEEVVAKKERRWSAL